MQGVIYKYTNRVNGKVYIGQTVHENLRRNEHKCHSKTRLHTQSAFYNAIDKYGWNNFDYAVLERVEADTLEELKFKLNPLEIKYIQEYDSYNHGYNNTLGADHVGHRARAVLEYDMKGNLLNRYNSYLDVPFDKDKSGIFYACNHNNITFKGHIWRWEDNDITKMPYEKYSASKYTYYQWTKEGNLIKIWRSVIDAQKEGGFDSSAVIKCCNGKYKTHKGFIWTRELKTNKNN